MENRGRRNNVLVCHSIPSIDDAYAYEVLCEFYHVGVIRTSVYPMRSVLFGTHRYCTYTICCVHNCHAGTSGNTLWHETHATWAGFFATDRENSVASVADGVSSGQPLFSCSPVPYPTINSVHHRSSICVLKTSKRTLNA